jgi:hypothetical protein
LAGGVVGNRHQVFAAVIIEVPVRSDVRAGSNLRDLVRFERKLAIELTGSRAHVASSAAKDKA